VQALDCVELLILSLNIDMIFVELGIFLNQQSYFDDVINPTDGKLRRWAPGQA